MTSGYWLLMSVADTASKPALESVGCYAQDNKARTQLMETHQLCKEYAMTVAYCCALTWLAARIDWLPTAKPY